ncbi:MAG: HAMP domain-containing histidine kinase [Bacteroidales bacterium]|nr:HAMP domain-containing histidine kinase [Candidatus Liminaster caballi]
MVIYIIIICVVVIVVWFFRHQRLLETRAKLMREAIRNRDFSFRLPVRGLFSGERALQEALNDLGRDINQLVAQNEVESWQKLTRVLTHEIMNATTPISSISQAYLNNPKIKGTPYEEGIRAIHDTSTGLTIFVDSYRKLTQLQEPEPSDIRLTEFIAVIQSLFPTLDWHTDIPAATQIHADENLLRQVFINITKNAIEADANVIDIRLMSNAICISNNGKPIPADVAREIFIPFFTTKKSGTGIGLALSRQIMIMQGGNLTLAEHPIGGYHVSFCLSLNLK